MTKSLLVKYEKEKSTGLTENVQRMMMQAMWGEKYTAVTCIYMLEVHMVSL